MVDWRLFLPWHWLALATTAKSFRDNPVIGNPWLNTHGLHRCRKLLAQWLCERRRRQIAKRLNADWLAQYQASGMLRHDAFLSPEHFKALREELADHALPMIEMSQAPALTRRANLDAASCAHMPATLALLRDPRLLHLLQLVAGYRGQPIIALQVVRSDADTAERHDPQTDWHADTFHSTAKAWLFLHDVAADEGPFAYRLGSQRLTDKRLAWETKLSAHAAKHPNVLHARGSWRTDETTLTELGYTESFVAAVPANTLIVADTSGYHRRCPSPKATIRLEIYCSLRRNPFFAGWMPSLLGLPGLRQRWAKIYADLAPTLVRRGLPVWPLASEPGLRTDERARLSGILKLDAPAQPSGESKAQTASGSR